MQVIEDTTRKDGPMYRLNGFFTQNTYKTLYVLEELGEKYEFKFVDLMNGEQKTPEFSRLTPVGKVPLLQHDDNSVFESGAICRYVANVADSPLYPQDKLERARVDQWIDFFSIHLGHWITNMFYEKIMKKKAFNGEPDTAVVEESLKFTKKQLEMINTQLGDQTYLASSELTIADLFAFAYVEQLVPLQFSLDPYPNVKRWFDSIEARESIKKGRKVCPWPQ